MLIDKEEFELNGHKILLRNADMNDAQLMLDCYRTVCGETRFLSKESDEVNITLEQEKSFIEKMNESRNLLLLAFVDGEFAGNCSFDVKGESRRNTHRAGFGITLFQKYTGFGLGHALMERALNCAKSLGYDQIELTVVSTNERAQKLYKKLGFEEYGRLPNANKYDDGTYADDILMVKKLK